MSLGITSNPNGISASNICRTPVDAKGNPIINSIKKIKNTIIYTPSNLADMSAVSMNSTLGSSPKLDDKTKGKLRSEINEYIKTENESSIKELYLRYAEPLLNQRSSQIDSHEQLSQLKESVIEQFIDDKDPISQLVVVNKDLLEGKIERFKNHLDSMKQATLEGDKNTLFEAACRVLEECTETLVMPDSQPANSEPKSITPEELKQSSTGENGYDADIPTKGSAKSYPPVGNVYNNCTFYHGIKEVSANSIPPSLNITVNANGADIANSVTITANEKEPPQGEKDTFSENKIPVMQDASTQTSFSQQNTSTQNDDYDEVDGFRISVEEKAIEELVWAVPALSIDDNENRADGKLLKEELPSVPLSRFQSEPALNISGAKNGEDDIQTKKDQPAIPLPRSKSESDLSVGGYQKVKGSDGKVRWKIEEKPHASNHIVLTNGTRQTANNAGTQKYFNNDSRRIEIDGVDKSDKATKTEEVKLGPQENLGRTLNVNVTMDINEDQTEAEISGVDISISPTNDAQRVDSSNINSRTGQPFKYSVSADKNVILTRDGQVSSLANKRSYSESDLRFEIEGSS